VDNPINIISVCSGIGGLDRGVMYALRSIGFTPRTNSYVEREAFACAILAARMETGDLDAAPVWTDITNFPAASFAGCTDMVIGGIPCQGFSVAGKRAGVNDARWLWPDFWRIVRESNAKTLFIENVPGFVSGGGLAAILSDLALCGWTAQWDCFTAAEIGAPHKRKRFFLLANAAGIRSAARRPVGAGQSWRPASVCSGADMADADGGRWDRQNQSNPFGNQRRVPELCGAMGDADGTGLEGYKFRGTCDRKRTQAHGSASKSGKVPVWPPGPGDRNAWERIAAVRPDLVPAIENKLNPRFVNWLMGLPAGWSEVPGAARIDMLRALGNAVVPATAELALITLWNRMKSMVEG